MEQDDGLENKVSTPPLPTDTGPDSPATADVFSSPSSYIGLSMQSDATSGIHSAVISDDGSARFVCDDINIPSNRRPLLNGKVLVFTAPGATTHAKTSDALPLRQAFTPTHDATFSVSVCHDVDKQVSASTVDEGIQPAQHSQT